MSREVSFFIDILKPVVDAIDTPETKELPKREINKPKEKKAELNPHDLPPVMKVAAKPNDNRQITNEPDFKSIGRPEIEGISDDNAGLADDGWMNDKTSSQLDISGNIRVIDLKVEGSRIAVQLSDEATDRAERFKGELADGSPLPTWVKVDRNTGLTTADPPPGAQPFEMRVVAEDGGGNSRAIDLVLDPTMADVDRGNTRQANEKIASNMTDGVSPVIAADSQNRSVSTPDRATNRPQTSVNVLADGQVAITEGLAIEPRGSLRLMRMVTENDSVKVEITDDAREDQTRYEVRQKDGSAAPDWVSVNVVTGELIIDAPTNVGALELTVIALDGGSQRTMDIKVDLEEAREDEKELKNQSPESPEESGAEDLKATEDNTIGNFVPLDALIDDALADNNYGQDLQIALQSRV